MRINVETGAPVDMVSGQAEKEIVLGAREDLTFVLPRLGHLDAIRIEAGPFGDGSVFSQARLLRRLGFEGRLCAQGPLISDQLHMARGAGFDEIEPSEETLLRHNSEAWRNAAGRYQVSHLARLKNAAWPIDRTPQNA